MLVCGFWLSRFCLFRLVWVGFGLPVILGFGVLLASGFACGRYNIAFGGFIVGVVVWWGGWV